MWGGVEHVLVSDRGAPWAIPLSTYELFTLLPWVWGCVEHVLVSAGEVRTAQGVLAPELTTPKAQRRGKSASLKPRTKEGHPPAGDCCDPRSIITTEQTKLLAGGHMSDNCGAHHRACKGEGRGGPGRAALAASPEL